MSRYGLVRNHIGGRSVDLATNDRFVTIDPARGEVLAEVEAAGPSGVDRAVEAAEEGFRVWSKTTGAERAKVLRRVSETLRARNAELAEIETRDTGKPIQETQVVDILSGADCLDFYAGIAATLTGEHVDLGPNAFGYVRREPLGVCAGIGAWNYPIQIACWKSAPALACGNAMIFKPAELTPLTAVKLAEIYAEAGLPDGVFNVVQGDAETGKALVAHDRIAKVSLTGEVGTGKTTIVRTLLEQRLADVDVAMVHNPRQSEMEFVQSICDELHVGYQAPVTLKTLVDALNSHLLKSHAEGRRTVLIIDEAQNLRPEVLEQVRLLTNLETTKDKLLRIMLIGQPELRDKLDERQHPEAREVIRRIEIAELAPMAANVEAYYDHKFRRAGADAASVFSADAFDAMRARWHHYDAEKKTMLTVPGSGGVSVAASELEGRYAMAWARNIWADTLA